ncbi:MAG: winged-helix domain-containing protein [Candidatus Micrarchaeia archaeon]
MIPESQYIESTIVVRDMRMPQEVTLTKASLIRWLALALGLINPNESRKSLIDLVEVLLNHQLRTRQGMSVDDIMSALKSAGKVCSEKTVRYHLLRMERRGVVRRKNKEYSFIISDLDDAGIESIADSYDLRYKSAMDKIRIALSKLKGMY